MRSTEATIREPLRVSFSRGRGQQPNTSSYERMSRVVTDFVGDVLAGNTPLESTGTLDAESAALLRAISIHTVDDFLRCSSEYLVEQFGSRPAANRPWRRWRDELSMRSVIPDLSAAAAQLLVAMGYSDARTLATTSRDVMRRNLSRFLTSAQTDQRIRDFGATISDAMLDRWLNAARQMHSYASREYSRASDVRSEAPPRFDRAFDYDNGDYRYDYDRDEHSRSYVPPSDGVDGDYAADYSRSFAGRSRTMPTSTSSRTESSPARSRSYARTNRPSFATMRAKYNYEMRSHEPSAERDVAREVVVEDVVSEIAPTVAPRTAPVPMPRITPDVPTEVPIVEPADDSNIRESTRSRRSTSSRSRRSTRSSRSSRRSSTSDSTSRTRSARASERSRQDGALKFYLHRADPVVDAPSIGARTAEKLRKVGIVTVADLLSANAKKIAAKLDDSRIDAETIALWQAQTTLCCCIPQLRGHDAQILVACGVKEPAKLARMDAAALWKVVGPFASSTDGKRIIRGGKAPDQAEVRDWIEWSKQARPLSSA